MPAVYTFDSGLRTIVKIAKRGKAWIIHKLKEVQIDQLGNTIFIFEDQKHASWHYKPFEDKDVSSSPDPYLEDVKRWEHHKIHRILGTFKLEEKFSLAAYAQH